MSIKTRPRRPGYDKITRSVGGYPSRPAERGRYTSDGVRRGLPLANVLGEIGIESGQITTAFLVDSAAVRTRHRTE